MSRIDAALQRAKGATDTPVEEREEQSASFPSLPGVNGSSPWKFESAVVPAPPRAATLLPPTDAIGIEPEPEPVLPEPVLPEGDSLFEHTAANVHEKLVVAPSLDAASVEQYRRLAAILHQAQTERGLRTVMVASALSTEGKTLTATNLALTLSESYHRRVLLVDADLRRPTVHSIFGLLNASGLSEGLKATGDQKLPITQVSKHLSILTAGKPEPDPMSLLTSERMRSILAEATSRFDWVIVDTPPVGLMPDAHVLSSIVEATVFVIWAGRTPHSSIQRAVEAIGRDHIIGVVLNKVDDSRLNRGYDASYYAHYGRSGEPDSPDSTT